MQTDSTPDGPALYWHCVALASRFWARVDFSGECWEWTGCLNHGGYGVGVDLDGNSRPAHRIAFMLATGRDPGRLLVCHTCDNRKCVRPDHLFLGSHLVNNRDMMSKGRHANGRDRYQRIPAEARPVGSRHGRSKLTEAQVAEIRERYARLDVTQETLAAEYGVERTTIGGIIRGVEWRHV